MAHIFGVFCDFCCVASYVWLGPWCAASPVPVCVWRWPARLRRRGRRAPLLAGILHEPLPHAAPAAVVVRLGVLLVALATRLLLSFRTHAAQSSSANANTVKASGAASLPPPDEEPLKRVLPRGLSIVLSAYGLRGEDPANEYMLFACACPQLPGLGLERGLCCSNCTAILFDTF